MKTIFRFGVLLCMALTLAACGTGDGEEDGDIQLVESEPLEAVDPAAAKEVDSRAVGDPYVGEYCDYDTGEPNLEIQKNEDETSFSYYKTSDTPDMERNSK